MLRELIFLNFVFEMIEGLFNISSILGLNCLKFYFIITGLIDDILGPYLN